MKQIILSPENGWKLDQLNMDVITEIYDIFTPLYEKQRVQYLNFTVATGSFEDKEGNTLWFEFFIPEEEFSEGGHLIKLEVHCNEWSKTSKSIIVSNAFKIKQKFGLMDVTGNDD
ncbi:hypothetical protein FIU82_15155 [Pseudoalteromonas sp. THAF3]|uniref:hypothetical protein n=1 Tax=Pseudoalteromonas sp. THAF3 TaxID=2587843 RepID=UPI0012695C50|nr:hypothetical protein [Pseudoalteromonas sp. THAF3]QFU06325.1 hypothetical protein FIU82_15155 [Pseudoalteromonas sp. THAF3]